MEEFYQQHVQGMRENGEAAGKDAGNLGVDITIKPNDLNAEAFSETYQPRPENASYDI
jgi:hypothetical protein